MRVRIKASQKVHYDQIVEMTPEEWEAFKDTSPGRHTYGGGDLVGGWLDPWLIDDADDIDEDSLEVEVVDEFGKPTGDSYRAD